MKSIKVEDTFKIKTEMNEDYIVSYTIEASEEGAKYSYSAREEDGTAFYNQDNAPENIKAIVTNMFEALTNNAEHFGKIPDIDVPKFKEEQENNMANQNEVMELQAKRNKAIYDGDSYEHTIKLEDAEKLKSTLEMFSFNDPEILAGKIRSLYDSYIFMVDKHTNQTLKINDLPSLIVKDNKGKENKHKLPLTQTMQLFESLLSAYAIYHEAATMISQTKDNKKKPELKLVK